MSIIIYFVCLDEIAICGESLDITFILPFIHFQPQTMEIKFFVRGETVMLRSLVPESNTLRRSIISLARSSDRDMYPKSSRLGSILSDGDHIDGPDNFDEGDSGVNPEDQLCKGWRRRTGDSNTWVDIWSVPVIILNLYYKFHPMPVENDFTRAINKRLGLYAGVKEPQDLASDVITVELEAGPSAIRLFGHFWRQLFLGLKVSFLSFCCFFYHVVIK